MRPRTHEILLLVKINSVYSWSSYQYFIVFCTISIYLGLDIYIANIPENSRHIISIGGCRQAELSSIFGLGKMLQLWQKVDN